jgi:uncharacterized protein with ParB-like and HNH nuclease domain
MSTKVLRTSEIKSIADLLGDSAENTTEYFQCDRDIKNSLILIPEHQRYYVWSKSHQESLIDSIMNNFPMPLLVFTEYVENNKQIWYVQDGQQRLTTIQRFIQGKFEWNGNKFEDLTNRESRAFLGYQIACSIIKSPTDAQVADIFERLNKGKTLSHNDKFYNRKNEPIIDFTINELKSKFEKQFKMYTNLNIKKKQRTELSDVVGAVISICSNNVDNITTSYERIGSNLLNIGLTDEKKLKVIDAFDLYFKCIEKSMDTNEINKPKKCYLKLSNMFGIWLYWYLNIRPNETTKKQQKFSTERFLWFANQVQNKDKGKIFKDLDAGAQRNLNAEALEARTKHLFNINIKEEIVFEINEEEDDEGTEDEDDEDDIYEECRLE